MKRKILEGTGGFPCSECGERFPTNERLTFHKIHKHTKAYPYICDKCSYGTTSRLQFKRHLAKHPENNGMEDLQNILRIEDY